MRRSRKRMTLGAAALLAAAVGGLSPAKAATLTFQEDVSPSGTYDMEATYVRGDNGNKNGEEQLIVGKTTAPDTIRALFGFNLSTIPDGSTINSVTFGVRVQNQDTGSTTGATTLELARLAAPFDEAIVTNTSQPANSTVLSSLSIDPRSVAVDQLLTFGSTSAFVSAVQAASDANGSIDFALKLAATPEGENLRRIFFFRSDEYNGDLAMNVDDPTRFPLRPILTVDYTPVPEPASLGLLGVAAACGLRRRRRTA